MKKQLLALATVAALTSAAQTTVTVSVGPGYADQKWYSFENGVQGTQAKDNWDLGFEVTGFSSAILANTQKANFGIYKAPYKAADFGSIDTLGMHSWPMLYNSDTTWNVGAFNSTADPNNAYDLGWGTYDINTHYVTGDSCYVVKSSATSYKKLKLVNLANGIYNFQYANINGSSSQTIAVNKSTYTGKNFVYFDMTNNTAVDREPAASSWDLTFGRYTASVMSTHYPVVGVLSNKGVTVAQVDNIANPSTYANWFGHVFRTNISEIGHDWKTINLSTNAWGIVNDTVYFVKDRANSIWKMKFLSFGGSGNGNAVFNQTKISVTGIANEQNIVSNVAVYPNPSNGESTTLLFASEKSLDHVVVSIADINGRILSTQNMDVQEGLTSQVLDTQALNSGVYFVHLNAGSQTTTLKLIKN